MERIYCISGLGADHRIFQKLHIEGHELVPVNWVGFDKHDDVPCYAQKMAAEIKEENPIILGVSFGGMLAVEIGNLRPTRKIFIVSSAKSKGELGDMGGFLKWLIKTNILPAGLLTTPNSIALNYFGAKTDDERKLLSNIMRDSDGAFMKWALKALLTWNNSTWPSNVTHVHGTADRIIPTTNVHPDYWIKDGTHIMVYNRAAEVSKIISRHLSS